MSQILFDATETVLQLNLTNNTRRILRSGVVDTHINDHSLVYTLLRITLSRFRSKKIYIFFAALKTLIVINLWGISVLFLSILWKFLITAMTCVFEALYYILDEHSPLHFNSNLKDISGLPGPFKINCSDLYNTRCQDMLTIVFNAIHLVTMPRYPGGLYK